MSGDSTQMHDDSLFKRMEIVMPAPGLTRPTVTNPDSSRNRPCTIMRPVNIDIIITPCDSSIKDPYEHSTLPGKAQKPRSRWICRRRNYMAANWISSHVNERKLRQAATSKSEGDVRNLIEKDLDLNLDAADDRQRTALHISAANGCQEIVRLLLQNGANPNVKDVKGNSPLHLAACSANVPIITLLLSHGADIAAVDFNGQTPLHLALARLKLYKSSAEKALGLNALKVKADVKDIADLLKEYIGREGTKKEQSEISVLRDKLQKVTSEQEVRSVILNACCA